MIVAYMWTIYTKIRLIILLFYVFYSLFKWFSGILSDFPNFFHGSDYSGNELAGTTKGKQTQEARAECHWDSYELTTLHTLIELFLDLSTTAYVTLCGSFCVAWFARPSGVTSAYSGSGWVSLQVSCSCGRVASSDTPLKQMF